MRPDDWDFIIEYWGTWVEVRIAACELRIKYWRLRIEDLGLRIEDWRLRNEDYGQRIYIEGMRIWYWGLRINDWGSRVEDRVSSIEDQSLKFMIQDKEQFLELLYWAKQIRFNNNNVSGYHSSEAARNYWLSKLCKYEQRCWNSFFAFFLFHL